MKRTENIQKDAFRKGWRPYRLAPVALAISAAFILAGCEQTDKTVSMYQNADDCSAANLSKSVQCTTAYNNVLKKEEKTAAKYASKENCVAEFSEVQCTPVPAQAGSAAQTTQTSSSWMPLMAGYVMGRMMSGGTGFAQQPLLSSLSPASPANGQFVDASGKSYVPSTSSRTVTVPKTALAPKSVTTNTITRGGFGESVAKQTSMQRSSASTSSSSSSRSMGG
ncbi:MAG: DUF1190 family protein [Candidatus Malihini olakiniferum]